MDKKEAEKRLILTAPLQIKIAAAYREGWDDGYSCGVQTAEIPTQDECWEASVVKKALIEEPG